MYILGLQGSPRPKGNTAKLLSTFLSEAESLGARVDSIDVPKKKINPCQECRTCETKDYCALDDDMQEIYFLLRKADVIVLATPIFFYAPTAQIKCPIDRSQALWARRYVYKLEDPGRKWRRGLFLAVGATKGKDLFKGSSLTAKYFYDAVGATFLGNLAYHSVEKPGDIEKHATALDEVKAKARELVSLYSNRKSVLFVCTENACRSQMASAFTQFHAGDRFQVESAGSAPADTIDPIMVEAMREKGIDMIYRKPNSIEAVSPYADPDLIVSMGCEDACPFFPGIPNDNWDLPDPAGKPIDFMRQVRDDIEKRVNKLITSAD